MRQRDERQIKIDAMQFAIESSEKHWTKFIATMDAETLQRVRMRYEKLQLENAIKASEVLSREESKKSDATSNRATSAQLIDSSGSVQVQQDESSKTHDGGSAREHSSNERPVSLQAIQDT